MLGIFEFRIENANQEAEDKVVTPRTFFASVSSVVNARAVPIFADVDKDSSNITGETIAVHLAGWKCWNSVYPARSAQTLCSAFSRYRESVFTDFHPPARIIAAVSKPFLSRS